ncbi:unnamed protein product [Anisakis simplex]|uniref:Col_cuticle_N domain-containing protein n=1 Tax=Anisakis simplex TaxID=6269 RepID=A0A0M3KDG5_ANISI|nr:unnamed protein product [Anisakis simplex]
MMMLVREAKVLIAIATVCSCSAMLVCLTVVTMLYGEIDVMQAEVFDNVQIFRVDTDAAWSEIMQLRIFAIPPSKARENPFKSIFRRRKRQDFSSLPDFCHCEPLKVTCPPGPPGPAGDPGPDGRK